jgi:biopolymer transport protein ExbB
MQIIQYPLQYWRSGGVLLIPLAAVCFGIWLYFLRTRRRLICETEKATRMAELLRSSKPQGLQQIEGPFAAFVYRMFCQKNRTDDASGMFDEESGRYTEELKRDIVVLAALTTIAPLLGLMGTVGGMIQTFHAVAATSSDTAIRVASGVSRALITTQVGLVIAIPGVFGLARLRRMAERLQVKLGAVKLHALLLQEAQ